MPPQHNPYEGRLDPADIKFNKIPKSIYFYYVGLPVVMLDGESKRPVKHFYFTNNNRNVSKTALDGLIEELIINARREEVDENNRQYNPPKYGSDWKYVVWDRRSYIVIVIDDPGVSFISEMAITFNDQLGSPNHTFFDARDRDIYLPDAEGHGKVAVLSFINHMKRNSDGDSLEGENQFFRFELNTVPPLPDRIYPDSGGTNMGPPVPPP